MYTMYLFLTELFICGFTHCVQMSLQPCYEIKYIIIYNQRFNRQDVIFQNAVYQIQFIINNSFS